MSVTEWASLLGNIGEFVGAIAVLATLIYLAIQVRQNTNTIAGATEMDIAREMAAFHARITADPELIELYEKAASNQPMSELEILRYRWLFAEVFWLWEGVYRQHLRGLISDENWENIVATILGILRGDVMKAWWESRASALSNEFYSYIDQRRSEDAGGGWHHRSVGDLPQDEPAFSASPMNDNK
ncbi:MAG: hypothetical protein V7711_08635 [Pseudomonadales bacterium]